MNKSAQSNLGRGPCRATVAHVRRKVPIRYNGLPQIRPKGTPSRGPIPKPHYLPHPWTRPTYDAKRHPDTIRCFSTMHWTGRPTHRRTDRQIVHGMTKIIGRCATTATRPNNIIITNMCG